MLFEKERNYLGPCDMELVIIMAGSSSNEHSLANKNQYQQDQDVPYLPLGPQEQLKKHGRVFMQVFWEGSLRRTSLAKGGP